MSDFIVSQVLHPSKSLRFDFDASLPYFIQESADETLGYDRSKPYFIVPISSATNRNIEPLKYAMFDLIDTQRKKALQEAKAQ